MTQDTKDRQLAKQGIDYFKIIRTTIIVGVLVYILIVRGNFNWALLIAIFTLGVIMFRTISSKYYVNRIVVTWPFINYKRVIPVKDIVGFKRISGHYTQAPQLIIKYNKEVKSRKVQVPSPPREIYEELKMSYGLK